MNRRNFVKTAVSLSVIPLLGFVPSETLVGKCSDDRNTFKTPCSVFTFGEIDDFCKEWGWIHVKEFIQQKDWIDGHKPPYFWSIYGQGQFLGIDGNKYMTWNTYRTQWIGPIKTDPKDKEEFRKYLKLIAGDYYGPPKREHYYFYDVLLSGAGSYDCWWYKKCEGLKYDDTWEPNVEAIKYHGQPCWNVVLHHLGVTDGEGWGYTKDYKHLSTSYQK